MKSFMIAILVAISITACATSERVPGPDGHTAFSIECGTMVIGECYRQAARDCPGGYTLISSQNTYNANQIFVQCK